MSTEAGLKSSTIKVKTCSQCMPNNLCLNDNICMHMPVSGMDATLIVLPIPVFEAAPTIVYVTKVKKMMPTIQYVKENECTN